VIVIAGALLAAVACALLPPPAGAHSAEADRKPLLGWSSWSFLRHHPSVEAVEAEARAMRSSGLAAIGYRYVNLDGSWYVCPKASPAIGPAVDSYGRWIPDPAAFPSGPGGKSGIALVAHYVHRLGLKFGLYVTPGISAQAVAQNTPIEGTRYHASDIATTKAEKNYQCHGMVGIDYSKPAAQKFIESWAREFASWGVDYLKLDGVGDFDVADVRAWSRALQATGRPIHLELSPDLAISRANAWRKYAQGWRTGRDIECYCSTVSSYPLTDWENVSSRFDEVAAWAPYGGPGGFNDYDSIEVGNGPGDGLTVSERKTQLSLWALAASPLILGSDLTHLDRMDLSLLRNTAVLAVDQDAIDARRIAESRTYQVFSKREPGGDAFVGLFNTDTATRRISVAAARLGLPARRRYELEALWTHRDLHSNGPISATVPAHGVVLYRVRVLG
jgi:hypothetical protein